VKTLIVSKLNTLLHSASPGDLLLKTAIARKKDYI
jgi:hypothetical protein